MAYTKYDFTEYYKNGRYTDRAGALAEMGLFSQRDGDRRVFEERRDYVDIRKVISLMENSGISEMNVQIVCLTAHNTCLTDVQLTEFLNLRGYMVSKDIVNNAVKKLHRSGLLLISYITDESGKRLFTVISLDKMGSQLASKRDITYHFSPFERIDEVSEIKKILMRSRMRLEILKSGLPASRMSVREKISASGENECALRPSITVEFEESQEMMFIEIVRREEIWQSVLLEKLERYSNVMKHMQTLKSDRSLMLIVCAESKEHAREIKPLLDRAGLDSENILFTDDETIYSVTFCDALYTFEPTGEEVNLSILRAV